MAAGPFNPAVVVSGGSGGGGGGGEPSIIKGYTQWLHKGSNASVREPVDPWDLINANLIYNHDYAADPARPPGVANNSLEHNRIRGRARTWSRCSICVPRKFLKGNLYATSKADGTAIDGITWWPANTDRITGIAADAHGGELKYPAYYHFNADGTIGDYPAGDSVYSPLAHVIPDSGFTLAGGKKWIIEYDARAADITTDQMLVAIQRVQAGRDDVGVAINFIPYGSTTSSTDTIYRQGNSWNDGQGFNFGSQARTWKVTSGIIVLENDTDFYCLHRPGSPKTWHPNSSAVASTTDTYATSPGSDWPFMGSVTIYEVA